MTVTAGALSLVSVSSNSAVVVTAPASGGTGPYTYQYYRSTTASFTPGAGNIIPGATSLSLNDTGLIPNTQYYYKNVATDTGAGNATSTSNQLSVATAAPSQAFNTFAQGLLVGKVDLPYSYNTLPVMIDASQATPLYFGAAVKVVDSAGGPPKVVGCSANSDEVFGFINYDMKTQQFLANSAAEISMGGNVIYLYATAPISRGQRVQLDLSSNGGVAPLTASSGADIVGYAIDKAPTAGTLIRVHLMVPSFAKA